MRPNQLIIEYQRVAASEEIKILDTDFYSPIISKYAKKSIHEFLDSLSFQSSPALFECQKKLQVEEAKKKYQEIEDILNSEMARRIAEEEQMIEEGIANEESYEWYDSLTPEQLEEYTLTGRVTK